MGLTSPTKNLFRLAYRKLSLRLRLSLFWPPLRSNPYIDLIKRKVGSSVRNLLADSNSNNTSNGDDSTFALNPSQCFSLIFKGDWTLDLMMVNSATAHPSPSRYSPTSKWSSSPGESPDEILDGLDLLLETYQRAKRLVANDVLLLRYVWLEADKDQSNTIKPNEIGDVLDKINYYQLNRSQLSDVYDKFAKVIGLDKEQRRQGLTFEQTCTLLHKIKRDSWVSKPVNHYWNIVSSLSILSVDSCSKPGRQRFN